MTAHSTWNPTDRDRLIFRWVKFDGRTQSWVASQLGLDQSTVSRIVDRYQRWIAHGGPSRQGGLTRQERLRAQSYLTYERNEWILASCLRLADDMEHMSDTSKSTTKHYGSDPSRELEIRTEHSIRDRTGQVCRYLRLAHRVNMDQQKLVEKDDLSDLEPLTLDPNELSQATADSRDGFQLDTPFERVPADSETLARSASEGKPLSTPAESDAAARPQVPSPQPPLFGPDEISHPQFAAWHAAVSGPAPEPTTHHSLTPMPATHNPEPSRQPLNPDTTITSVEIAPAKKPAARAFALPQNPPETTDPLTEVLAVTKPEPKPIIQILPIFTPTS